MTFDCLVSFVMNYQFGRVSAWFNGGDFSSSSENYLSSPRLRCMRSYAEADTAAGLITSHNPCHHVPTRDVPRNYCIINLHINEIQKSQKIVKREFWDRYRHYVRFWIATIATRIRARWPKYRSSIPGKGKKFSGL